MVFILSIFLNIVFYQVPQYNLNGGGDFNKIMTPNTQVVLTKEFIKNKIPELLKWPANSSDLNLIENYWNVIERLVEKRKSTNIDDLEQFMNEKIEKQTQIL